jgi:hypothetical protein
MLVRIVNRSPASNAGSIERLTFLNARAGRASQTMSTAYSMTAAAAITPTAMTTSMMRRFIS